MIDRYRHLFRFFLCSELDSLGLTPMITSLRKVFRLAIFATAALLLAASCSSDGDSTSEATTTSAVAVKTSEDGATTTAQETTTTSAANVPSLQTALENGVWTDNVSFAFDADTYTINSDGVPSHEVPDQWAVPNDPVNISADNAMVLSGLVAAQDYSFELPLNPVYSETATETSLGTIGLMVSGAALFNPYEGGGGIALDGNFNLDGVFFIDACNGHPQQTGAYHYHGIPYCITDAVDVVGEHSTMIGVLFDGFPIYGPNDVGGIAASSLDECSGHTGATPEFPDGIYHYHLTETAPYSVTCYHGEVADGLLAAGAPGDAGDGAPPDAPGDDDGAPAGAPDLSRAAATLGVTEQELMAALGPPPPDFETAADALGVTVGDLMAALG
jgi:hypothetical protein